MANYYDKYLEEYKKRMNVKERCILQEQFLQLVQSKS